MHTAESARVRAAPLATAGNAWPGLIGVALLVVWGLWILLVEPVAASGQSRSTLMLISGVLLVVTLAHRVSALSSWFVPASVALAGAVLVASTGAGAISRSPVAGPLGYANANAALFLQCAVAGVLLGGRARLGWVRLAGFVAAAGFVLLPILNGSRTAVVVTLLLAPAAVLVARVRAARAAIVLCAACWVAVLVATTWLAGLEASRTARDSGPRAVLAAGLSERRLELWGDAFEIAAAHPLRGAGPGGFERLSAAARLDRDARFAHHEFLQHAAEHGLPSALLMTAVFAWGFALLLLAPRPRSAHVTAAVGMAALGIHASIDYVLHFAPVSLTAAALLASVLSNPARRHTPVISGPARPARIPTGELR